MHKKAREPKSVLRNRTDDRVRQARQLLLEERARLLQQLRSVDEIIQRLESVRAASGSKSKNSLEELFQARDRTKPGSAEERQAAERILESVFPDTNIS